MRTKTFALAAATTAAASLVVAACGGDNDHPVQSGVFFDSPVKGLYYEASPSGQTGMTDANGTFRYVAGDQVTFYAGTNNQGTKLGTAPGAAMVTPVDVTQSNIGDPVAMLQTLQSLDADGNPNNGIDITSLPPGNCNLTDQSGCKVDAPTARANFASAMTTAGATYLGQKTVWKTQLQADCLITRNGACFKIMGVTYSPSPVGYDSSAGPALGDLFWDSYKANDQNKTPIWNWYSLWGKGHLDGTPYDARDDLGKIKAMGVNTIRVYAMLSRQLPAGAANSKDALPVPPPKTGNLYTHKTFLEKCAEAGLQVMVDIPLPSTMFVQNEYDDKQAAKANDVAFWENVLEETVTELKDSPVVMGFNIMNEKDGPDTTFNQYTRDPQGRPLNDPVSTPKNDFFYYQALKYATEIKQIAPDKLVGWAIHDDPTLLYWASNHAFTAGPLAGKVYFEELAKVFDYWGTNTYHADDLNAVLGTVDTTSAQYTYTQLPAAIKKPVIFTEFGWPGAGRTNDDSSGDLVENATTRQRAANTISDMYDKAYGPNYKDYFAGAFFFSYSMEWWKSGDANVWNKTFAQTAKQSGWPNFYWDEEAFGLYKITSLGKKDPVTGPWCNDANGPCLPYDTLQPMTPMTDALAAIYAKYRLKN
jgi:hypothetical protein